MWQPLYAVYLRVLRLANTGALGPGLTPCCRLGPLHGWLRAIFVTLLGVFCFAFA